jgi:hypothetical protein
MSPVQGSVDGPGRRGRAAEAAVPGVTLQGRARDAGSGDVWSATVDATGASCTVRRLRLPPDTVVRDEALHAAQRLVAVRHPHLAEVQDAVQTGDGLALVYDPVPGAVSLTRLLDSRERLEPGEVVTIGLPIAQALAAAHAAGVSHGDLSGEEILVEPAGRPVLAGIGAAALVGVRASPADDVGDLAALLLGAMPQAVGPDAAAVAVAVAPALVDDPARRPSADELAEGLARACVPLPVAGLAQASPPSPPPVSLAPVRSLSDLRAEATGRARTGAKGSAASFGQGPADDPRTEDDPRGEDDPRTAAGSDSGTRRVRAGKGPGDPRGRGARAGARASRVHARRRASGRASGGSVLAVAERAARIAAERAAGVRDAVGGWLSRPGAVPVVIGVALVAVLTVLGLVVAGNAGGGGSPRAGHGAVAGTTASTGASTRATTGTGAGTSPGTSAGKSPAAGSGPTGAAGSSGRAATVSPPISAQEARWRTTLGSLNTARSRAFETAQERALRNADAPGSPAYAADVTLMRAVVARGAHASPLRTEILTLAVRTSSASRTVLRITDQLGPYYFLDKNDKALVRQPGKAAQRRDVTLVRVGSAWRISTTVLVAG